jgi:hypothetical protein
MAPIYWLIVLFLGGVAAAGYVAWSSRRRLLNSTSMDFVEERPLVETALLFLSNMIFLTVMIFGLVALR